MKQQTINATTAESSFPLWATNNLTKIGELRSLYFISFLTFLSACSFENNSPCILQATYDSGPSSSFNFRKDGTFEWTNGSGMGISQDEGSYTINDNLITLNKVGFDKVVKSKHLKITSKLPWSQNTSNSYVVQVNDKGELVDSIFIFRVYIDKRNQLTN